MSRKKNKISSVWGKQQGAKKKGKRRRGPSIDWNRFGGAFVDALSNMPDITIDFGDDGVFVGFGMSDEEIEETKKRVRESEDEYGE